MGHRTLSLKLVFRALFLDSEAFDELREDDNPFVEGLFLVVLLAFLTAFLALLGQILAWATTPQVSAAKQVVWATLQQQPWWAGLAQASDVMQTVQRVFDAVWLLLPAVTGVAEPSAAALNLVVWPAWALLSWLLYGVLAHGAARLLGGRATLNQTLGTTALAFAPWLLRGLGLIPFLVLGGVVNTWQLILRYKALRSAHRLSWGRAFWATVLPFVIYGLFWLLIGIMSAAAVAAITGR